MYIFLKYYIARLYCVVVMILHAYVDVYILCVRIVGHGYTIISLSVKQGGIKYHFKSLWYDATCGLTQVSRTIGEHSPHSQWAAVRIVKSKYLEQFPFDHLAHQVMSSFLLSRPKFPEFVFCVTTQSTFSILLLLIYSRFEIVRPHRTFFVLLSEETQFLS